MELTVLMEAHGGNTVHVDEVKGQGRANNLSAPLASIIFMSCEFHLLAS